MLRVASFAVLVTSLFSLAAYQFGYPKCQEPSFPANSTIANFRLPDLGGLLDSDLESPLTAEADSAAGLNILLLNYTAYDSAYALKVRRLIEKRLPGCIISDFWGGGSETLGAVLNSQEIVVVTYPAKGNPRQVRAYGKVLAQFVQQGGAVVFSGTDQFGILQQYGLFDVDFGYFCSDLEVHEDALAHPVLDRTPADFLLSNYVYPLDVSDPAFVMLADVRGYPALGFKPLGKGKVVYIGLEYYYDDAISTQILENTLRWLSPAQPPAAALPLISGNGGDWSARSVRRSQENLYAGSGKAPAKAQAVDLKIYPNPYVEKATLDIELEKPAPVSIEMTDEAGVSVTVLLPYRHLNAGLYRLELPNVAPGVYFVKCQIGGQSLVRKVVKMAAH